MSTHQLQMLFFSLGLILLVSCSGESSQQNSSSDTRTLLDACTLLTPAEIEATMGVAPGDTERPNAGLNACQWANPQSPLPVAYIGLSPQNIGSWEEYRTSWIENGMGDPDVEGERIDIGRFGHYHQDASMIQVQTDRNLLITLRVRGSNKAQVIELARKAMARL